MVRGLKVNNSALQRIVDRETTNYINKHVSAGIQAMKELRSEATNEWFGYQKKKSGTPMNDAMRCSYKITSRNDMAYVYITSGIDSVAYEYRQNGENGNSIYSSPYSSAVRWVRKHEKPWTYNGVRHSAMSMQYTIGEYLIKLKWELGYVGLPPYATDTETDWVNEHFASKTPMEITASNYINNNWNDRVNSIVKKSN